MDVVQVKNIGLDAEKLGVDAEDTIRPVDRP
jgi:hypothetical protein